MLCSSGTWYEETADLSFMDYLTAKPSELSNTWRRKLQETTQLAKRFFAHDKGIDQAITDYRTVYDPSWKSAELFPEFVPALIRLAAELKALRLGIYYPERTPAAVQFWIVWGGRAFICKLAYDKL